MVKYEIHESGTGEEVPVYRDDTGRTHALHSLIDPRKEAKRLIDTVENEGFLIFLGLGGGFFIEEALKREGTCIVIIIEYDNDAISKLLTLKDYSKIISDKRCLLLVDLGRNEITEKIINLYKPVLHSGIRVLPLRPRVAQNPDDFINAISAVEEAIERVKTDYSVQAHFGKKWFSNIINNLKFSYRTMQNLPVIQKAAVIAAGPSLNFQIKEVKKRVNDFFLIATDTSLPRLLSEEIIPDAIISIDCQQVSSHHFMAGIPKSSLLFIDLLSPPLLSTLSENIYFFSGGHPLTRYISSLDKNIFELDTSGGNVTFAGISLAEYLGAEEIVVYGADFSYPHGVTYAKGTYVYPYFESRQNRFSPIEAQCSAFLYRTPLEKKYNDAGNWYYETASMKFYREKLEEKSAIFQAKLIPAAGEGARINVRENSYNRITQSSRRAQRDFDIKQFMENYIEALKKIEHDLNANNLILSTILPLAAFIKKQHPELNSRELLINTVRHCLKKI
ncbi:MAG: DUF115 domain-containing protein [Treponema sp.]|nr:DUF115 domain-containing protein [Treponema sp.]